MYFFKQQYMAVLTRDVDGDTVWLRVDMGLRINGPEFDFRLARINAPETKTPAGPVSSAWITDQLMRLGRFRIETLHPKSAPYIEKDDDWHRWLVELWDDSAVPSVNLNDQMANLGLAVYYKGAGPYVEVPR